MARCPKCGGSNLTTDGKHYLCEKCSHVFPVEPWWKSYTSLIIPLAVTVAGSLAGWIFFKTWVLVPVIFFLIIAYFLKGSWRTLVLVGTVLYVIFGTPFLHYTFVGATYDKFVEPMKDVIINGISRSMNCVTCYLSGEVIRNPLACEERCSGGPEISPTEQLIDISVTSLPTSIQEGSTFPAVIKISLLAKDESVRNLVTEMWLLNESACSGGGRNCENGRGVQKGIVVCPTTEECTRSPTYMECSKDSDCKCGNLKSCNINKNDMSKTVQMYFSFDRPSDSGESICKDDREYLTLTPRMLVRYSFDASASSKIRVSKGGSTAPQQDEKKVAGPIGIDLDTDKEFYNLENDLDKNGFLTISIGNTEYGTATVKGVTVKEEYEAGLSPFNIEKCGDFKLSPSEEDATAITINDLKLEQGDSYSITCKIARPPIQIKDFSDYRFTVSVSYDYYEINDESSITVKCQEEAPPWLT